ncbi:hypothetical protein GCM10017771_72950 [Streptomyces capitiformicae]|uniref:Uncharacterized protein n=1 Tax=Streptomyces capitiformicae TaxID=2014920 RepID=A0A919DJJ3_9ACTN|nr:hypothetical protein GCM10017771_72950 [Streptomyces capitiformicae]
MLHEEAADGVDEAGLVGAGEREDELAAGTGAERHDILQWCVLSNIASDTQHGPSGRGSGQEGCLDRKPSGGLACHVAQ